MFLQRSACRFSCEALVSRPCAAAATARRAEWATASWGICHLACAALVSARYATHWLSTPSASPGGLRQRKERAWATRDRRRRGSTTPRRGVTFAYIAADAVLICGFSRPSG